MVKNENVGYLSAFCCGVLVFNVWKDVGMTTVKFFQTLDTSRPQPKADKQPTFSFFAYELLFHRLKKEHTPKICLLYSVILNRHYFLPSMCLDLVVEH